MKTELRAMDEWRPARRLVGRGHWAVLLAAVGVLAAAAAETAFAQAIPTGYIAPVARLQLCPVETACGADPASSGGYGATASLIGVGQTGPNTYVLSFLMADHTLQSSEWTMSGGSATQLGTFTIGFGNVGAPILDIDVTPGTPAQIASLGPTKTEDMAVFTVRASLPSTVMYQGDSVPIGSLLVPFTLAPAPTPTPSTESPYAVQYVGYGEVAPNEPSPGDSSGPCDVSTAFTCYGTEHTFQGNLVNYGNCATIASPENYCTVLNSSGTVVLGTYNQTVYDNQFASAAGAPCTDANQAYGHDGESGSPTLFPVATPYPDTNPGSSPIIGLYADTHSSTPLTCSPLSPPPFMDYYGLAFSQADVDWINRTVLVQSCQLEGGFLIGRFCIRLFPYPFPPFPRPIIPFPPFPEGPNPPLPIGPGPVIPQPSGAE